MRISFGTIATTSVAVILLLTTNLCADKLNAEENRTIDNQGIQNCAPGAPSDFTSFYFSNDQKAAQSLNRYLWYHFNTRLGNNCVLFNKEYLTTTDTWLADAIDSKRMKNIQDIHRDDLGTVRFDDEGYVFTHQHFSHAHEHGWPFPLWTQSTDDMDYNGKAMGWHFQYDGPGWVWDAIKAWKLVGYSGDEAVKSWRLHNVKSLGISDSKWQLESTGESPSIMTPEGTLIDSFQAPFLQLRWTRTGEPKNHALPYVEWMREQDTNFSTDRRVYFTIHNNEEHEDVTKTNHCMIEMYTHPKWTGKIKCIRICLAPGESNVKFAIDSFFTCYDTRQTINNPIFILSCWNYFRWTGDIAFLRENINRMREALKYQQTVMGGLKYNHIHNTWPGHDGIAGFKTNSDGSKTIFGGHGIGNNYFDLLPFGYDDMYATSQYYAATLVMADVEEAIANHPGWYIPGGALTLDPTFLRKHAAKVKEVANKKFWNEKTGRFVACIDKNGVAHDYGFTFLNLDSIWYGIASEEHAQQIMAWISGKRIVDGDTSTGTDIYRWTFGPRCTTKRNIDWYGQAWFGPESIPWGGQVQDGGAVLGFTFYDLWARLKEYGANDSWKRFSEILKWQEDVDAAGGYREYYKDGKRGTTLQGGGSAGGIGIDYEFYESILVPSIVTYGYLGLDPKADELYIKPNLPDSCPEIGINNVLYHYVKMDIKACKNVIDIQLKDSPESPISIALDGNWKLSDTSESGSHFKLADKGSYRFERK